MKVTALSAILLLLLGTDIEPLKVNSLQDLLNPPAGTVTLRSALNQAVAGKSIIFDSALNGGTILLTQIGKEHTPLKGEVMGIRMEPSGPVSYLIGYFYRDYGRSALYAKKNVIIDASALPQGITVKWAGNSATPARVLAVDGNLTLKNVNITGGNSVTVDISATNEEQPWTLARGGGVAVWGHATIENCEIYNNHCEGDFDDSRDRGAFGGGVYANIVEVRNSVVSGNSVLGAGAAGGGIYSVGGADSPLTTSKIEQSTISGNKISGIFTYGGGVYSDGGGIGNLKYLKLINSTIARNLVEPAAGQPPFIYGIGYWRGGGVYMSNGYLSIQSCTIVENETHGYPRTGDLGKSNLAGGVAATIGNAHAVEEMRIAHSILSGNSVTTLGGTPNSYEQDIFTGSLLQFKSGGYNRIGIIDFSQILVPVGQFGWHSLSRKHYPQIGDMDGVVLSEVADLTGGIVRSNHIQSLGTDASQRAVLSYHPQLSGLNQIPHQPYSITNTYFEYRLSKGATDNFLEIILNRIENRYGLTSFAVNFINEFEDYLQNVVDTDDETAGRQPYQDPDENSIYTLADTQWFGPVATWPSNVANYAYIDFWHQLDEALMGEAIAGMGPEILGDSAWQELFPSTGPLTENPAITMIKRSDSFQMVLLAVDQLGSQRPVGVLGDIGAIELQ